jgi:hypothetical protein
MLNFVDTHVGYNNVILFIISVMRCYAMLFYIDVSGFDKVQLCGFIMALGR